MEIISLQNNQEEALAKAEAMIKNGGLIATPTDTVYGIIGDATNAAAIERLYELKHRPVQKAFPVFVRDIAMARWFAYISDAKARFLERIWPGAVTVIFHHKEKLPQELTAEKNAIAIRIPDHPFVHALLDRLKIPLVQSSANLSGMPPARRAEEIVSYFEKEKNKPDLIINGGEVSTAPSIIIDLTTNDPRMVRAGPMDKERFGVLIKELSEAGISFHKVG